MRTKRKIMAAVLAFCLCIGAVVSGISGLQAQAATSLSDWQGYWGDPVVDGEGIRVSTNATYTKQLSPAHIEFELKIGAMGKNTDWLKFGLGKYKADMDGNSDVAVRFWNVDGKLKAETLHGTRVIEESKVETGLGVNDSLKVVIAKADGAEAWDVTINGTKVASFSGVDFTKDGKTYLGFASWADTSSGIDRAQALYYTINSVSDTAAGEDPKPEDPKPEDPKPEDPKPDDPKPENPKPEDPKPEDPGTTTITEKVKTAVSIGMNDWNHYWADPNANPKGYPPEAVSGGIKIVTNSTLKAAMNPEYIEFTMKIGELKADSTDWIKFGFGDNTKDYDRWAGISFVLRNVGGKLGVEGLRPSVFDGIELDNVKATDTLKFVFEKNASGIWSLSVNGNKIADLENIKDGDFCTKDGKTYLGFASWADTSLGQDRTEKLNYTISSVRHMTTVVKTVDKDGNVVSVTGENGAVMPQTGDVSPMLPWVLCCLAMVSLGAVLLVRRRGQSS